jgi:hypothetical protein
MCSLVKNLAKYIMKEKIFATSSGTSPKNLDEMVLYFDTVVRVRLE